MSTHQLIQVTASTSTSQRQPSSSFLFHLRLFPICSLLQFTGSRFFFIVLIFVNGTVASCVFSVKITTFWNNSILGFLKLPGFSEPLATANHFKRTFPHCSHAIRVIAVIFVFYTKRCHQNLFFLRNATDEQPDHRNRRKEKEPIKLLQSEKRQELQTENLVHWMSLILKTTTGD